jgi:serine/threonine-protein kinase
MNEPRSQIYEFDEFRVDAAKRLLTKGDGEQIQLTPKVFDTLLYLVRNHGKVIGKDELMREIWTDSVVEENNLNQNISILRRIFGEKPGEQRFIVTVAGHGYRFVPDVRTLPDSADVASSGKQTASVEGRRGNEMRTDGSQRRWMFASAIIVIAALGVAGVYIWMVREKSPDAPIKTIAVLPFKPLVAEHRNEALELGLADTLISELSGNEEIVVRPLSAIRRYNALEQDSLAAARELGVESVLDGTIQTWGDRIRISAKLIRTSDGKQLWSGQFDEKFTDLFVVQDTISEKVAAALKIRFGGRKRPTENIEAYQLYMKGRYQIAKGTPSDLKASIPFFEQAIGIDPGYALAYTGLSHAYGVLGLAGDMTIPGAVSKARDAEQKALELDDTLGEAHNTHCMGLFWYDWDWDSAEKACLRSIEIDPNNSDFHGNYAMLLSNTGRHAEALAEAKRSRELNPLNLVQNALEGQFLLHAGRTDEALVQLRKMSELEPNFWMPHMIAASAYIEKRMFAEAIAESERERNLAGGNVYPLAAYALARSGKRDEARTELNKLLGLAETKPASAYNIALIYNALDESEKALDWLEKAYQARDTKMTLLKVEPKWNNLRNERRFVDLMRRMKFAG